MSAVRRIRHIPYDRLVVYRPDANCITPRTASFAQAQPSYVFKGKRADQFVLDDPQNVMKVLVGIAINKALERYRRAKRWPELVEPAVMSQLAAPNQAET